MRLLDLFCGAGGAAVGYHRAGFEVVGVDLVDQPRYPFEFFRADALTWLDWLDEPARHFDAVHASPPCQAYSRLTRQNGNPAGHPRLIGESRARLLASGLPFVVENVGDAVRELVNPVRLCGSMFDLGAVCDDGRRRYLERHRYFECHGFWLLVPPCRHVGQAIGVYGGGGRNTHSPTRVHEPHGYMGDQRERTDAMGIDWMTRRELVESIPPAYTEFIGSGLVEHLTRTGEAAAVR